MQAVTGHWEDDARRDARGLPRIGRGAATAQRSTILWSLDSRAELPYHVSHGTNV